MQGSFRPYEASELGANRSTSPPLYKRVEDNLIATFEIKRLMFGVKNERKWNKLTVSIFLPPRKFINDSKRDTLLETTIGVRSPSKIISFQQKPERKIEILRDVRFRPLSRLSISRIHKSGVLNRRPAQKCIMPHERRNLAIRAAKRYTLIDAARKVGDPILKVMIRDLHDIFQKWKDPSQMHASLRMTSQKAYQIRAGWSRRPVTQTSP